MCHIWDLKKVIKIFTYDFICFVQGHNYSLNNIYSVIFFSFSAFFFIYEKNLSWCVCVCLTQSFFWERFFIAFLLYFPSYFIHSKIFMGSNMLFMEKITFQFVVQRVQKMLNIRDSIKTKQFLNIIIWIWDHK